MTTTLRLGEGVTLPAPGSTVFVQGGRGMGDQPASGGVILASSGLVRTSTVWVSDSPVSGVNAQLRPASCSSRPHDRIPADRTRQRDL